jgi:NhaP-type Na+/H+ or K+/H+ antiporter
MQPATRFVYGADIAATLVAAAYVVTAQQAWREVAVGAFWWAVCGAALLGVLDGGAWWMLHRDAKRHESTNPVAIAGRIGDAVESETRRAA